MRFEGGGERKRSATPKRSPTPLFPPERAWGRGRQNTTGRKNELCDGRHCFPRTSTAQRLLSVSTAGRAPEGDCHDNHSLSNVRRVGLLFCVLSTAALASVSKPTAEERAACMGDAIIFALPRYRTGHVSLRAWRQRCPSSAHDAGRNSIGPLPDANKQTAKKVGPPRVHSMRSVSMSKSGRALRLGRLFKAGPDAAVSLHPGPYRHRRTVYRCAWIRCVAGHPRRQRRRRNRRAQRPSAAAPARRSMPGWPWFVHLSASTRYAADPTFKYQVAEVEDCLRRGADTMSVHVNIGSLTEDRQLRDMAGVGDACDRAGLPLLAMLYPRGPGSRIIRSWKRCCTRLRWPSISARISSSCRFRSRSRQ